MSTMRSTVCQPTADTPLARFLVGLPGPRPSLDDARRATLSGTVLMRLPDHPDRDELHRDELLVAARHLAAKVALRDLFRAWNEADIVPLAVKGFYLAEFVYASAGLRVYGDIDLFVEEARVPDACDVARDHGWVVIWRVDEADHIRAWRGAGYRGHEAAQLRHPVLDVRIDVHRRLVHNSHEEAPSFAVQERLTDAAVRGSYETRWCGTRIRLPSPVDAVVFGLALNRCWSADGWRVKPRDYCDFDALRRRHGLDREGVRQRAREIGVHRTLDIYLERCDPFRRRLLLAPPRWRTWWWNMAVTTERGPHDLVRSAMEASTSLTVAVLGAWLLVRTWSLSHRAARFMRLGMPLDDWRVRHPVALHQHRLGRRIWRAFLRAIHRQQRLRGIDPDDRPSVAALVAFAWLRARGYGAELSTCGDVAGPVTLLLDGSPLDATLGSHAQGGGA